MYISVFTVLLDHLSALAGAQSHLLTFLDATEMKLLHQMLYLKQEANVLKQLMDKKLPLVSQYMLHNVIYFSRIPTSSVGAENNITTKQSPHFNPGITEK